MNRVTIVIANYNYGNYVVNALASALNQTHKCNIVLVDDGSTDDSMKNILGFLKPNLTSKSTGWFTDLTNSPVEIYDTSIGVTVLSTENSGASTARNIGIKYAWAETDVFAILDSDDEYLPTKAERLLAILNQHDEIGVAYADYTIYRTGEKNYRKYEFKQPYSYNKLKQECIVHSGALIKKKYLEKVLLPTGEIYDKNLHGPLSKGFIGCTEDYDLWLRLSDVCIISHCPVSLSIVNETGQNQSMRMNGEIFQKNMQIIQQR